MRAGTSAATVVAGVGAQTAIGRNAWSSAAAARAGLSGFCAHPSATDTQGEPFQVAMCDWLDPQLTGVDRLEALLVPALDEARAGFESEGSNTLLLGLPPERSGWPASTPAELAARLRAHCGSWLNSVEILPHGHAAGLLAVEAASVRLAAGAVRQCLVAAVDSYLDPTTLRDLEAHAQVHGAGATNNAWGFVPGEGAAALMLARPDHATAQAAPSLARVLGAGRAFETKRIKTDAVCVGEGLTVAISGALAGVPSGLQVDAVYCDLNGEPYRSDEFGFAVLRLPQVLRSAGDFIAAADCWGDVGAAGGVLNVAYACTRFAKGLAEGPLALVWGSAENGARAAVLLARGD